MAEARKVNVNNAGQVMVGDHNNMCIQAHVNIPPGSVIILTPGAGESNSYPSPSRQGQGQGQSPQERPTHGPQQTQAGNPLTEAALHQRQVSEECSEPIQETRQDTSASRHIGGSAAEQVRRQQSLPCESSAFRWITKSGDTTLPYMVPGNPLPPGPPAASRSLSSPAQKLGDTCETKPLPYALNPHECPKQCDGQTKVMQLEPRAIQDSEPIRLETMTTRTPADEAPPDLSDITVIYVESILILVVSDIANEALKVIHVCHNKPETRSLVLPGKPVSIAALTRGRCIVSYMYLAKFSIVSIGLQDLKVESVVSTDRKYTGVAALEEYKLAACCWDSKSVDLLDLQGQLLETFPVLGSVSPCAISVTSEIFVTDWMSNTLVCLSKAGKELFAVGIKSPKGGLRIRGSLQHWKSILLADEGLHQIIDVGMNGAVATILFDKRHGIEKPRALCKDRGDTVYIAQAGGLIKAWKLEMNLCTRL